VRLEKAHKFTLYKPPKGVGLTTIGAPIKMAHRDVGVLNVG